MPSACDILSEETSQNNSSNIKESLDKENRSHVQIGKDQSDKKDYMNGYIVDEVDDQVGSTCKNENEAIENADQTKDDHELIFVHDTGFSVKIDAPGVEIFDIQVSSMELVQEIHHLLMDREDTCSRTCFSLSLNGTTLDNFAELKSIEDLKEGCVIKVNEEPYTVRESRIHVRHIRDLLKSLDSSDAYNGHECNSLSFLNVIAQGDILDKKRGKTETVDCTPPSYILPGSGEEPLSVLQPQTKDYKNIQALKVLTTSGWNPPPGNRKLHGDLMYLYVITSEDKRYHITSSTRGFYINMSTDEEFNPKPVYPKVIFHSLIELLSYLSPIFKKNFSIIQKKRHQKHPFERVATPYQVYSWTAPNIEHSIDSIRAEDAFSSKLGYEEHLPGQTRDWNEELQTTKELSRKTFPERLLRERAIFKVHSDFVAAATRGAMSVVDGNVMAINPGEDQKMQMFIWHNIFFSLGFDIKDHYKELGGDSAAFVAPNNDLQGVKAYSRVDVEGLYTLGTVVVDYRGFRVTAQSIIPGILEREQEHSVVYGSVDFGKTVVSNEKYLKLLGEAAEKLFILPHKVINEKEEVVEICSSVDCKGIIGNDGRHYILDLLRTFPPDVNYFPIPNEEYSENVKKMGFPKKFSHKLCCLRQELVSVFIKNRHFKFTNIMSNHLKKMFPLVSNDEDRKSDESTINDFKVIPNLLENFSEKLNSLVIENNDNKDNRFSSEKIDETKESIQNAVQELGSLTNNLLTIRFNPDVYSPLVKHYSDDPEQLDKDKKLVKEAAEFLLLERIPMFINDCLFHLCTPFDGFSLSEALHNRGINIRYLGTVTNLIAPIERLKYLHTIAVTELICRSAKHFFTTYIQNVETIDLASAISLFLNCLLSDCNTISIFNLNEESQQSKSSKRKQRKKNKRPVPLFKDSIEWASLSPSFLLDNIKQDLRTHYSFELEGIDIPTIMKEFSISKVATLRSFCKKVGIQILLRDYDFKNHTKPTFKEDDILNIFPIVKHIQPRATDACEFYSTGETKIQQGFLKEGYELISESLNLLNNVYGAMHPEIAQCLRTLARLNYIMGDFNDAMACQQKAVLMSEKVNGVDHSSTITEYTHLALYCFANQQVTIALKLLYRARYLLLINSGENHPEMAILDSNIGLILHSVGENEISLQFLKNALKLNIFYYGAKSINAAISYDLVARSQSYMGEFRSALQNEKETYSIYKEKLGEDHEKSVESSESLKHLTQQAVILQRKLNEMQKNKTTGIETTFQIQQPSINSILQTLNLINGIIRIQP